MFMEHVQGLASYWARLPADTESVAYHNGNEAEWRCSGLLHSILCVFDGSSASLPAFDITASPHPDDKKYHQENEENWWTDGEVINDDVHLHDLLNEVDR